MSAALAADADAQARLARVRARIDAACARAGRTPSAVVLIGVSKTHPPDIVQEMVDLGVRDIGENRVQELLPKMDRVHGARWHFVGRLQSNKARDVVGRQLLVHGLDRRSLADALSRRAEQQGELQRVLVQVNVGDDPAKGGCPVDETLDLVAYARALPALSVEGLMTVPPLPEPGASADEVRPHFARLRALRDRAREDWPEVTHLSMGMSDDVEIAVEEGATMVRVGTALFGSRREGPWRPDGGTR